MINNIGIDIVTNKKIKRLMNKLGFIEKVLSEEEIIIFNNIENEKRKVEYVAGRFTAKEAIIKSITNKYPSWNYKDISILNDETGRPYMKSDLIKEHILISISHCDEYTVSMAINEEK